MKKPKNVSRTKMLMLLSLMFLSIAVLCMGVLAAESATYNIAGNISYNMVDYVARINTRVYKVEGQTNETGLATGINTLATMTFEQIEKSTTTPYYILSQKLDTGAITRTSDTTTNITGNVNIEYGAVDSSVEYYTFYVVINIKEITGNYLLSASLNETISSSTTSYKKSNQSQSAIEKSNTQNIVIGFSLKSTTANSTESFSYTLTVEAYSQTSATFGSTKIYTDESIDYWYIKLGTTSSGEDIRWKLVSTDGTSKYVYDASTTPSHSDLAGKAIFVQQSVSGGAVAFAASNNNNYYNSDIRTNINTLSNWNLTDSDVSSLISKRNITGIEAYDVDGTYRYTGKTDDYFWLLSDDEVNTFLGTTNTERKWIPEGMTSGVCFWLRTPHSSADVLEYCVDSDGRLYNWSYGNASFSSNYYVRAAFVLSSNTSDGE